MLDNQDVHVIIDNEKIYLINIIKHYFEPYLVDLYYKKIDKEIRHKDLLVGCSCWKKYGSKFNKELDDFRRLFHKTPNLLHIYLIAKYV